MRTIRDSIDIQAPVATVFQCCAQFQDLPGVFPALHDVVPLDPNGARYRLTVPESTQHEWEAEITELSPDERIGWRHLSGPIDVGQLTLRAVNGHATQLHLELHCHDDSGIRIRVGEELERLKCFVEAC